MNSRNAKAILLMAGSGTRFQSSLPKQFHRLSGKKIYLHTLEHFIDSALFNEIFLVCADPYIKGVQEEIAHYQEVKITLVAGGETRQDSCYRALKKCDPKTEVVVIHDAVRPFVSQAILKANVEAAYTHKAIDTCIPSSDTLVYAPEKQILTSIPKREEYLRGQTPQSFAFPLLLRAHEEALKKGIHNSSDDCSLVMIMGEPVHVVAGSEVNIKITSELDLLFAEQILGTLPLKTRKGSIGHSLAHKIYILTGGSGGIGSAIAELLKKEGALPLIVSRTSEKFPTDLTSFEETEKTFAAISDHYGAVDGLINCVGHLRVKPFHALSQKEIDQQIQTNFTAVAYSCRCAMLKPSAHLINIASSSYQRGRKNYALYSSAKAAVVNFTQGLADENPHLKIHAVIPQRTATPMRRNNFPEEELSTLMDPKYVAQKIVALLKQEEITARIIPISYVSHQK